MRQRRVETPANDHPPAILAARRARFVVGRMEDGWLRFYPDDLTFLARQPCSLTLADPERDLRE